ncbi:hypothetical protein PENTCL1PPCAC_20836, partial [Pristionchus entomophagus]
AVGTGHLPTHTRHRPDEVLLPAHHHPPVHRVELPVRSDARREESRHRGHGRYVSPQQSRRDEGRRRVPRGARRHHRVHVH